MIDVIYTEEFLKDLKKLKGTSYYRTIRILCFDTIPSLATTLEIPSLKKLKGYDNYYRIRRGDYRIGVAIEGSSLKFLRCLSRKDIYRYFPQ